MHVLIRLGTLLLAREQQASTDVSDELDKADDYNIELRLSQTLLFSIRMAA